MTSLRWSVSALRRFSEDLLMAQKVPAHQAAIVADVLLAADLRGISSHGVVRLDVYSKRLGLGLVNPTGEPVVTREGRATSLMDGSNALGQYVAYRAMERCIEQAERSGVGTVGVHNTNHIGIGAYFPMMALRHDMIGLCLTNASAHMAPSGGIRPLLGTNPIAVAFPAGSELPVVLDMATSNVARGKVLLAALKGEPIPPNWALDAEGNPTTDPKEALHGTVLPLGGYKGYGLALAVDILSGILTGAAFGAHVPSMTEDFTQTLNEGIFLTAWRVDEFMDVPGFKSRMDQAIREIKACPRAPGVEEILLPGELEARRAARAEQEGISLQPEVVRSLQELGERHGVPFPAPASL